MARAGDAHEIDPRIVRRDPLEDGERTELVFFALKLTACEAMPNPPSAAPTFCRIGCSAVPPYPGARTAARFKPAASEASARARATGPEDRPRPRGARTCSSS